MSRLVWLSIVGMEKAPWKVSCWSSDICTPPKVPERLSQRAMFSSFQASVTYLLRKMAKTGPPSEKETGTTGLPARARSSSIPLLSCEK